MLLTVCRRIMTCPVLYVRRYRRTSEVYIVGCRSTAIDALLVEVNGLQLLLCRLCCTLPCDAYRLILDAIFIFLYHGDDCPTTVVRRPLPVAVQILFISSNRLDGCLRPV